MKTKSEKNKASYLAEICLHLSIEAKKTKADIDNEVKINTIIPINAINPIHHQQQLDYIQQPQQPNYQPQYIQQTTPYPQPIYQQQQPQNLQTHYQNPNQFIQPTQPQQHTSQNNFQNNRNNQNMHRASIDSRNSYGRGNRHVRYSEQPTFIPQSLPIQDITNLNTISNSSTVTQTNNAPQQSTNQNKNSSTAPKENNQNTQFYQRQQPGIRCTECGSSYCNNNP
jgi:hypothetical protein